MFLIAGLVPAGCAGTRPSVRTYTAPGAATYVYTCPDGYRFSVRFRGDSAVVDLTVQTLSLPHLVSASGARYGAEGVVFWTKGEQASLEVGTTEHRDCQGVGAKTPWEEAWLLGIEFRAIGQEPGWTLDLDRDRWIRFVGDYGRTRAVTPVPEPMHDSTGAVTHRAKTEAHDLTVVLRPTPCRDAMSGETFSHSVRVQVNGRELQGCGRELSARNPAGTHDMRTEIDEREKREGITSTNRSGCPRGHPRPGHCTCPVAVNRYCRFSRTVVHPAAEAGHAPPIQRIGIPEAKRGEMLRARCTSYQDRVSVSEP